MLTMFTCCWPWTIHSPFIERQENCLDSWKLLEPEPEVMICADEEGLAEACQERGLIHAPDVAYMLGGPVISSVFKHVRKHAKGDILCWANCDNIFMQDFIDAIDIVANTFEKFLIIGQKTCLQINERIDFSDGWQSRLRTRAKQSGFLMGGASVDYYVFRREHPIATEMPPLILAATAWDTWLVDDSRRRGFEVVDVTQDVLCVHQHINGDMRNISNPDKNARKAVTHAYIRWRLEEQCREWRHLKGKVGHAPWILSKGEILDRDMARANQCRAAKMAKGHAVSITSKTKRNRDKGTQNAFEARGDS